jgi:nucleotide-binding universal stress UspA family protein
MEFHKILIPIAGEAADVETVKLACQFARKEKAKLLVIHVIPIAHSLPLEVELGPELKKGEAILEQAERVALERGLEIETDLLQARNVGPSIVNEAVEREVDLIIMGLLYKRVFGQYSLGAVIPYVLKNAPCPIILFQQSQPDKADK